MRVCRRVCGDLGKHLALEADLLLLFLLVVGERNRLVEETHFWKKYHRLPVCQTNLSLCKDRLTIFFVIMQKERKIFCHCWVGLLGTSLLVDLGHEVLLFRIEVKSAPINFDLLGRAAFWRWVPSGSVATGGQGGQQGGPAGFCCTAGEGKAGE